MQACPIACAVLSGRPMGARAVTVYSYAKLDSGCCIRGCFQASGCPISVVTSGQERHSCASVVAINRQ